MRVVAQQNFKCVDVVLPEDFEEAIKHPATATIAKSIFSHGLIEPIGIEKGTNELVWGRKRFAGGHRINKLAYLPASIVTFDYPEEKEIIVMRENLDRADLTPDQRAEMYVRITALEAQRIQREKEEAEAPPVPTLTVERWDEEDPAEMTQVISRHPAEKSKKAGRPRETAAQARKAAASKLNVSESSIARAQKKLADKAAKKAGEEPSAARFPIPDHGLELPEALHASIAMVHADHIELAKALRKAIKLAESHRYKVEGLNDVLVQVQNGTPGMVCPYCALRPRLLKSCEHCNAGGWISVHAAQFVPAPLLVGGAEKQVYVGAKLKKASLI